MSVNDLVIKACALALRKIPEANASSQRRSDQVQHRAHIGMAVALEDGLITPVLRDCDMKTMGQIALEARDLAERARDGQATRARDDRRDLLDLEPRHVSASRTSRPSSTRPRAPSSPSAGPQEAGGKDGQIVVGQRMRLTLSCDHRVIDGALGARLLQDVNVSSKSPSGFCV